MEAIRKFSVAWLLWAVGILAFAAVTNGMGGGGDDPGHWMRWVSGAMMLGAYPAGAAAGRQAVGWDRGRLGPLVSFALVTIALGLLVVAVRGSVGPALSDDLPGEPATWSQGQRIDALADARSQARSAGTLDAWVRANQIGWEVEMTVTSGLTAIAFAWVGALLAAWLPTGLRREMRVAVLLGAGVFLLLTGYLMTENGYELLLLRMMGPAEVVAWFPLIAPGMAALGLLIPTLSRLFLGGGPDVSLAAPSPEPGRAG